MKARFLKFALPFGIGAILFAFTILSLVSTTFSSCKKSGHCTTSAYPLYCPTVDKCCPSGFAWVCDGKCYQNGCPSGTITSGVCAEE